MTQRPRAAFFGTPDFAVDSLKALAQACEVVCVFSQPDRRSGRGMKTQPTPVKRAARELGLEVEQPTKVRTDAFRERIAQLELDFALVVAFGRILPLPLLNTPRLGFLNVHASLLPRWRGAAPIQRAVMAGDPTTGVCLMQMDEGMDTGPVLALREAPIRADDTSGSLAERLAVLGATMVMEEVPRLCAGELKAVPQSDLPYADLPYVERGPTHAAKIEKDDARVRWSATAQEVDRQIRGVTPAPGAFSFFVDSTGSQRVKIHRARLEPREVPGISGTPGAIGSSKERMWVGCGQGAIEILELQAPGRRRVTTVDFVRGQKDLSGARMHEQGVS